MNSTAELFHQSLLSDQQVAVVARQPVVGRDVNTYEVTSDPTRHARRPAYQRVATGAAGDSDHDPLAAFPKCL